MNYLIKLNAMKLIINTFFSSKFKLLIVLLVISCTTQAQSGSGFSANLRIGGSLGLGFGDGFFTANLAPSVIYDINNYWSVGTGLSGSYTSFDDARAYTIGGSALAFFRPISNLRLSSEFEQLYVNFKRELEEAKCVKCKFEFRRKEKRYLLLILASLNIKDNVM